MDFNVLSTALGNLRATEEAGKEDKEEEDSKSNNFKKAISKVVGRKRTMQPLQKTHKSEAEAYVRERSQKQLPT